MKKIRLPGKKKLLLFLIPIIAIIVVLFFLAPTFQQKPKENITIKVPEPLFYQSPDKNFNLTYMDDWFEIEAKEPGLFSLLLAPPVNAPGMVRIDERYLDENRTLDQYYQNLIADYHDNWNVTDIKTTDTTVSGFPAKQIEFTWEGEGALRKKLEIITIAGNLSFSMSYKNRYDRYSANFLAAMNIFQSMRIARVYTIPTPPPTIRPTEVIKPSISSISPPTTPPGSPEFVVTITGTNFVIGSKVIWDGVQLDTTYLSPTRLAATIPAKLVDSAGTSLVFVLNEGNVNSNMVPFIISEFERKDWNAFRVGDIVQYTHATLSPYSYVLVTNEDVGRQYQVQRLYQINKTTFIRDRSRNGIYTTSYEILESEAKKVGEIPKEMLGMDTFSFQNPI